MKLKSGVVVCDCMKLQVLFQVEVRISKNVSVMNLSYLEPSAHNNFSLICRLNVKLSQ
jgi:hypothetical protein